MKERDTGKAEMEAVEADNNPAEESLDSVLDKLNSAIKVSDFTDYAANERTKIKNVNHKGVDEGSEQRGGEASSVKRESTFLKEYLEDRGAFSFLVLAGMKTPNPTPKTSVVDNPVNEVLFVGAMNEAARAISEETIEKNDENDENSNNKEIHMNYLASGETLSDNEFQVNCSMKQRNRKSTIVDGVLSDGHIGFIESQCSSPFFNGTRLASVDQIVDIALDADQICKDKGDGNSEIATKDKNKIQCHDLLDLDDASIPDLEMVDKSSQSRAELNNELQLSKKDTEVISEKTSVMETVFLNMKQIDNTKIQIISQDNQTENNKLIDVDKHCKIDDKEGEEKSNDIPQKNSETVNKNNELRRNSTLLVTTHQDCSFLTDDNIKEKEKNEISHTTCKVINNNLEDGGGAVISQMINKNENSIEKQEKSFTSNQSTEEEKQENIATENNKSIRSQDIQGILIEEQNRSGDQINLGETSSSHKYEGDEVYEENIDIRIASVDQIVNIASGSDQIYNDQLEENSEIVMQDNNSKEDLVLLDLDEAIMPDLEMVNDIKQNNKELNNGLQFNEQVSDIKQNNKEINNGLQLNEQENVCVDIEQIDHININKMSDDSQVENDKLKDEDSNSKIDENSDKEKEKYLPLVESMELDKGQKPHKNCKSNKKKALKRDTELLVIIQQDCIVFTDGIEGGLKDPNNSLQENINGEINENKNQEMCGSFSGNDKTECDMVNDENISIVEPVILNEKETRDQEIINNQNESDKYNEENKIENDSAKIQTMKADESVIENLTEIEQSKKEIGTKVQRENVKVEAHISNSNVIEAVNENDNEKWHKDSNDNIRDKEEFRTNQCNRETKPRNQETEKDTEKISNEEEENENIAPSNKYQVICDKNINKNIKGCAKLHAEKTIINNNSDQGTSSRNCNGDITIISYTKIDCESIIQENPSNKIKTKEKSAENIDRKSKNEGLAIKEITISSASMNRTNKEELSSKKITGSPSSTKKVNNYKAASNKTIGLPSSIKKIITEDLKSPETIISPSFSDKGSTDNQTTKITLESPSLIKEGSKEHQSSETMKSYSSSTKSNAENVVSSQPDGSVSSTCKEDLTPNKTATSLSSSRLSPTKKCNEEFQATKISIGSTSIIKKSDNIDTISNYDQGSSSSTKKGNTEDEASNKTVRSPSSIKKDAKKPVGSPSSIKKCDKKDPMSKKNVRSSSYIEKDCRNDQASNKIIRSPSLIKKGCIEKLVHKEDILSTCFHKNDSTEEKAYMNIAGGLSNSKKDIEPNKAIKKTTGNDPGLKKTIGNSSILNRGQKLFALKSNIEKQESTYIPSQEKPVSFDDLPSKDHVETSANKHRAEIPKGKRPPNRISWMAGKLERSNSQDQPKEVLPPKRLSRSNSNLTKETKEFTRILEKVTQDNEESTEEIKCEKKDAEITKNIPQVTCCENNDKEESNSDPPISDCKEKQINYDGKTHLKKEVVTDHSLEECINVSPCETSNKSSLHIENNKQKEEHVNLHSKINDISDSSIPKVKNGSNKMEERLSNEIELFMKFIANKKEECQNTIEPNRTLTTKDFIEYIAKKNIEHNADNSTKEFIDFILNKENENEQKGNHCFVTPDIKASATLVQLPMKHENIDSTHDKNTVTIIREKHKNIVFMEDDFVELDNKSKNNIENELAKKQNSISHTEVNNVSIVNSMLCNETKMPTKNRDDIISEKDGICGNAISDDEDSIYFEDCKSSMDDDLPDLEIVNTDLMSDDEHFHDAEKDGISNSNSALGNAFLEKSKILHIDNKSYSNNDNSKVKAATSTHIDVYDVLDAEVNQTPQCLKKIIKVEKENQNEIIYKEKENREKKNDKTKRVSKSDSGESSSLDRIAKERPTSIVDTILLGNTVVQHNTFENNIKDTETHAETIISEDNTVDNFQITESQSCINHNEDEEILFSDSKLNINNIQQFVHAENNSLNNFVSSDQEEISLNHCTNEIKNTDSSIVDSIKLSTQNATRTMDIYNINIKPVTVAEDTSGLMYSKSNAETNLSFDNLIAKQSTGHINDVIIDKDVGSSVDTDTIKTDIKDNGTITEDESIHDDNKHCGTNTLEAAITTTDDSLVNETLHSISNKIQSCNDDIEFQDNGQCERRRIKNRESCLVHSILASGCNANLTIVNHNSTSSPDTTIDTPATTDCSENELIYTNTEKYGDADMLEDNSVDNPKIIDNKNCSKHKNDDESSANSPDNNKLLLTIDHKSDMDTIQQNKSENYQDIEKTNIMLEVNTLGNSPTTDNQKCKKQGKSEEYLANITENKLIINGIQQNILNENRSINEEPTQNTVHLITKINTEQANEVAIDQNVGNSGHTDTIKTDIKNNGTIMNDENINNDNKKMDTNISEASIPITNDSLVNEVLYSISCKMQQSCDKDIDYHDNDERERKRIKNNRGSCLVDTILASGSNLSLTLVNDNASISPHTASGLSTKANNGKKDQHYIEKKENEPSSTSPIITNKQESSVENSVENTPEEQIKRVKIEDMVHRKEVCQAVLAEITEIVSNPATRISSRSSSRNESSNHVNLIEIGEVTSVMESKKKSALSALAATGEISGDWAVDIEANSSEKHSYMLLATHNSEDKNVNAQTTVESCKSNVLHDSQIYSRLETSNSDIVLSISADNMITEGNTTLINNNKILLSNNKTQEKKSSAEILPINMALSYEKNKEGKGRPNSIVDSILANQAQHEEATMQNNNSFESQNKTQSSSLMVPIHLVATVKEVNEYKTDSHENDMEPGMDIQTEIKVDKDDLDTTDAVSNQTCELREILPLCESMSLSEYMSLKTDETTKVHDEFILDMVQNSLKQLDFIELRYRGLNTTLEEKQAEAIKKLNIAEENFQECKREYDRGLAVLSSELISTNSNEERLRGIELVLASQEDAAVKLDRIKMLVTFGTGTVGDTVGDRKELRCSKGNRKYSMARRRGAPASFWKRRTDHVTIKAPTKTSCITDTKQMEEVTNPEVLPRQTKLNKKTKMKKQITRVSSKTKIN